MSREGHGGDAARVAEALALFRAGRLGEVNAALGNGKDESAPADLLLLVRAAVACGATDDAEEVLATLAVPQISAVELAAHRALILQRRGRWRESLDLLREASQSSGGDVHAVVPLLQTALRLGDRESLEQAVAAAEALRRPSHAVDRLRAAALTRLGRADEAEAAALQALDTAPDNAWVVRINRLIARDRLADAAGLLERAVPECEPKPTAPTSVRQAPRSITHVVMNNGHHILAYADGAELSAAIRLPVRLVDIANTPIGDYARDDAMVLLPCILDPNIPRAIKAASPGCTLVGWDYDNHHSYLWSALMLRAVDAFFPSHRTAVDYLPRWDRAHALGPVVPLATNQWPQRELARLWDKWRAEPRDDGLSSGYAFYPVALRRNRLLAETAAAWPEAGLRVNEGHVYHRRPAEERFLSWRRRKTSLSLAVCQDVACRFYDALVAGQVPILPPDIVGFDHVIPPEEQRALPVVRLAEYSVDALRAAHAQAIAAFDREGEAGAERRHRYAMNRHLLVHRVAEIVERTAAMCDLRLQQSAPVAL
jgi:hypothetical protein